MAKKKPITRKQKEGEWVITISDQPVTPDGKYTAKATLTRDNKILTKYAYGESQDEAQANIAESIRMWI